MALENNHKQPVHHGRSTNSTQQTLETTTPAMSSSKSLHLWTGWCSPCPDSDGSDLLSEPFSFRRFCRYNCFTTKGGKLRQIQTTNLAVEMWAESNKSINTWQRKRNSTEKVWKQTAYNLAKESVEETFAALGHCLFWLESIISNDRDFNEDESGNQHTIHHETQKQWAIILIIFHWSKYHYPDQFSEKHRNTHHPQRPFFPKRRRPTIPHPDALPTAPQRRTFLTSTCQKWKPRLSHG